VTANSPAALRHHAANCRRLAQEADHLDAIRELLRIADDSDGRADRLEQEGRVAD
jgi:hypothetical protein